MYSFIHDDISIMCKKTRKKILFDSLINDPLFFDAFHTLTYLTSRIVIPFSHGIINFKILPLFFFFFLINKCSSCFN